MSARPDTDAVVLPEDVGGTGGVLIPEVQGDDGARSVSPKLP